VKKLELKNGKIVVGSATSQQRTTYDHVNVKASDFSLNSKFPVTVSADLPQRVEDRALFRAAARLGEARDAVLLGRPERRGELQDVRQTNLVSAARNRGGALDDVPELPHVARPIELHERGTRLRGDAMRAALGTLEIHTQKSRCEHWYVLEPLPQRWERDAHRAETM